MDEQMDAMLDRIAIALERSANALESIDHVLRSAASEDGGWITADRY